TDVPVTDSPKRLLSAPMTRSQKERYFQISLWTSGALYAWGLAMLWMAPVWELEGWTYYALGVVPSMLAVMLMSTALGLYIDLQED
ncbi:MAG: hypothetical protein V5A22_03480, partial [Salinivenus sp.]